MAVVINLTVAGSPGALARSAAASGIDSAALPVPFLHLLRMSLILCFLGAGCRIAVLKRYQTDIKNCVIFALVFRL